jgi:hypothetical protein
MTRPIEIVFTEKDVVTTITELRVVFQITQDMEGRPNNATIKIVNMPIAEQNALGSRYTNISLRVDTNSVFDKAAKGPNYVEIFNGQVMYFKKGRENGFDVLRVIASDSQQAYNNAFISKSFVGAGASLKRIIQAVVASAPGLQLGGLHGVPVDYAFQRGLALCGTLHSVMNYLATTFNADWYVEANQLYFVRRGVTVSDIASQPVGPDTGLLDTPRATITGVVAKTSLRPEIKVGGLVDVVTEPGNGAGSYKLRRVQHSGDSNGMPWHSTLHLFRLEDEPPYRVRSSI